MLKTLTTIMLVLQTAPASMQLPKPPHPEAVFHDSVYPIDKSETKNIFKNDVKALFVYDRKTKEILLSKKSHIPLPIASLTKLATISYVLKHHKQNETVTIPHIPASKVYGMRFWLRSWDTWPLYKLVQIAIIKSANDAAYSLALHGSKSEKDFIQKLSNHIQDLGIPDASIINSTGLPYVKEGETKISASAFSVLIEDLLSYDIIQKAANTHTYTFWHNEQKHTIYNTNKLLADHNYDVSGLKTGTTKAAGQCLISIVGLHGREYAIVVLGSSDRYATTKRIIKALQSL